jgi:hypothetical protein
MAPSKNTEHCMVCGAGLVYVSEAEPVTCTYCGIAEKGHIKCPKGHYLCDACHGKDAMRVIEDTVTATVLKDPSMIAEQLMSHPSVPMLGCEHAYIAAGALLAALRNAWSDRIAADQVREVFERTKKQGHGGFCGLTGVCGIAPAIGAVLSVVLGAKCGSGREQKITMEAVIAVSRSIADLTGPSCCKAYVRAAIPAAVKQFEGALGISLPLSQTEIICRDSSRHPHGCREEKCPYFRPPSKDVFAESIHLPVTVCQT